MKESMRIFFFFSLTHGQFVKTETLCDLYCSQYFILFLFHFQPRKASKEVLNGKQISA